MKERRERKKGKSLFSLSTLLASFFGAAMIAGAFAYFNYKFAEYKFIDFKEWGFYQKNDLFIPKEEKYLIIFYSSKQKNSIQQLTHLKAELPVLAIDYYNTIEQNSEQITFLRTGTSTSLKFIQRFNIYKTPSIFIIKKHKDFLYKQDSMIHKLDNLQEITKTIKTL